MGLSKIARRTENKISRGATVVNKIVSKAPAVLNTTSNVLGKVGNIADKVSQVSGKILSNPIVEGFVAANPELAPVYGGAIAASKLIGQGGQLADKGSSLASRGASAASKASNVLEKVNSAAQSKPAIQFA